MIHDYFSEKSGFVSLWLGVFDNKSQLEQYVSDVYKQGEDDDIQFQQELDALFLSKNKQRLEEDELMEFFTEHYNQFSYDFGFTFDDDFREAKHHDTPTDDLHMLINKHSYADTFMDAFSDLLGSKLMQKYNAALLIYDCKYDGHIKDAIHPDMRISYMGSVPYEAKLTEEIAEVFKDLGWL